MRFLTALIFPFLVTPAFAGPTTLSTPAVNVEGSDDILCTITNTSTTKSLDVTISLHGQAGTLEGSSTAPSSRCDASAGRRSTGVPHAANAAGEEARTTESRVTL